MALTLESVVPRQVKVKWKAYLYSGICVFIFHVSSSVLYGGGWTALAAKRLGGIKNHYCKKKKRIGCTAIIEKATICWLILTQLRFAYLTFLVSPHTYGWVQLANRSSNSHSFKLAWKPFFWLEHFQAFFYLTHILRINWSYQQPWEIFSASCRLDFFSLCSFP